MTSFFAITWMRAAIRHVNENERYRWWPLYSACLAGFMYSTWYWPFDTGIVDAYRAFPWLTGFQDVLWDGGALLCVALGAVGLLRRNWFARGLSLCGIWLGQQLYSAGSTHGVGGEGSAASLWFVFFVVVWIAIRPLMKRAWGPVLRLESRILERWPVMHRFARPVM